MKTRQPKRWKESGAVAIFVVVFASLLMIIVTISFVQMMVKDQTQATTSDLSQSAYDSAQAGVEDAKRLLLLQQSCNNGTVPAGYASKCNAVSSALNSGKCDTVSSIFGSIGDTETMVQQSVGDKNLQQAYTCVKVISDTPDFKGQVSVDQSNIVPLTSVGDFDSVKISWFNSQDVASSGMTTIGFPSVPPDTTLPSIGTTWASNDPALLRTQFMQTGSSFKLSDFDTTQASGESDANTLFLYPFKSVGQTTIDMTGIDARRTQSGTPQGVKCNTSFAADQYACSVTLTLPKYDGPYDTRNAFLRLSGLYNGSHYAVQLLKGGSSGSIVKFHGVQPEVDSTGRANNMFRRVISRVQLEGNFAYPDAAVSLQNSLCKDFAVTDDPAAYTNNASCDPTKAN